MYHVFIEVFYVKIIVYVIKKFVWLIEKYFYNSAKNQTLVSKYSCILPEISIFLYVDFTSIVCIAL